MSEQDSLEGLTEDQIRAYAKAARALHTDPETSRPFKKLIKKKNPNYRDPELELDEKLTEAVEPLQKKLKEIEEARAAEKFASEREQAKRKIEERGLDFEKVEKFAQDKQIASYDTAADYYAMEAQMATPTSPAMAFAKPAEDIQKLYNNPAKLNETRRAKAGEAITEILRGRSMLR